MRKVIVSCVNSLIILSLVLVGCKGTVGQPASQELADTRPEKVRLRWFYSGGSAALAVVPDIAAAVNAAQDKIELEIDAVHPTESGARLEAMVRHGDLPDILGPLEGTEYTGLIEAGLVIDDLESVVTDELEDIDPALLDLWRIEGKLAGLPVGIRTSVLYYNRDLFDAAGLPYPPHTYGQPYADGDAWTIAKMQEIAMRLTLDGNGNNALSASFDPQTIVQYGFTWHWMNGRGLVNMFGADPVVDQDGMARIPDRWREGYRWYYDGIWEKHFIPSGDYDSRAGFGSGQMAMMVNNMWYLKNLKDAPFKWNLAAIPSYQGEATVDWLGGAMLVSRLTSYPNEAVEAAHTLATTVDLLTLGGYIPAFQSLQRDVIEALEATYPGIDSQAALSGLNHTSSPPSTSPLPQPMDEAFETFRDKVSTQSGLDLDAEIDELESELQKIVASER